jgi:hypothetical protein
MSPGPAGSLPPADASASRAAFDRVRRYPQ